MRTITRTRTLLVGAALAAALVTGGCAGGGGEDDAGEAARSAAEPAPADMAGDMAGDMPGGAADAAMDDGGGVAAGSTSGGRAAKSAVQPAEQAIVATGTVSLEARDVAAARFEVQKVVDKAGGTITEEETTTQDDGDLATARIVLRVPSAKFSETTARLEKVATLTGSSTGTEDVTTQVIDVEARIRSQEASVRRIQALLAQAGTLREIVSIESELSQRQADLDSLKSQQKYLRDQTSLSTITVHLETTHKKGEKDDRTGFLGGLANGWDGFVSGLGGAAMVLGYLLPWLLALAILGVPVWWLARARRGRRPAPARQP